LSGFQNLHPQVQSSIVLEIFINETILYRNKQPLHVHFYVLLTLHLDTSV